MTMRKAGDLWATVGEWTDDSGRRHKRKVRCGVLMQDHRSGRLAIRIEVLPVVPDWSGWLSVSREASSADVCTGPMTEGEPKVSDEQEKLASEFAAVATALVRETLKENPEAIAELQRGPRMVQLTIGLTGDGAEAAMHITTPTGEHTPIWQASYTSGWRQ